MWWGLNGLRKGSEMMRLRRTYEDPIAASTWDVPIHNGKGLGSDDPLSAGSGNHARDPGTRGSGLDADRGGSWNWSRDNRFDNGQARLATGIDEGVRQEQEVTFPAFGERVGPGA